MPMFTQAVRVSVAGADSEIGHGHRTLVDFTHKNKKWILIILIFCYECFMFRVFFLVFLLNAHSVCCHADNREMETGNFVFLTAMRRSRTRVSACSCMCMYPIRIKYTTPTHS